MPLGELAALLNAVACAATGVTAKTLSPAMRPVHVITAHTVIASAVFLIIGAATGGLDGLVTAPAAALLLFSAAALLNTVGGFIFFTAISTGSVGGTYTTTTGLYILLSLLAGVLFLGETVGPLAAVGAAGIACGVYILNGPGRITQTRAAAQPGRGRPSKLFTGLGLGAGTAVLWTIGLLVMKWGLDRSDVLTGSFMRNSVAASLYLAYALAGGRVQLPRTDRRDWLKLAVSAGFFASSVFSWNYALAHASAGKTAVLASASPVFAMLMAVVVLRERLNRFAVAGAAVAIAGTLLVVAAQ